ncbi:chemotaxis protein CheB [Thalassolituus sp.]|uniref:chemotaxis protein CheB n=1 Tax=Thalassolituus sp. TaxID=2030822 RepID=UPI003510E1F8
MSSPPEALQPTHYIGIGASAGGLEALQDLFANTPSDSGVAYIVVQHLSPDYKSMMPELLSRHSTMPIQQVTDSTELLADHIYLMPPRNNMMIADGKLLLTDAVPQSQPPMPIDFFFKSLAQNYAHRAVGIILSGTGSDGTRGVKSLKEAGGMVIVQEPDSAKFDGMPRSAVNTGFADLVLEASEIGASLVNYFKHPLIAGNTPKDHEDDDDNQIYEEIFSLLKKQSSINFSQYKASTVARRIERRLSINQLNGLNAYHRLLLESPKELHTLSKELLIGVTRFFRDEAMFEYIQGKVVPELVKGAMARDQSLRIWVAGCSTGEEAYSLAILFKEYIEKEDLDCKVSIFATDVDSNAIAEASTGLYAEDIQFDVNPERLEKYFEPRPGGFQIMRSIRESVIFATHNMLEDPPFSNIDLVTCRNVLIYFQQGAQKRVLSSLFFALRYKGFLWLGPSESMGDLKSHFDQISERNKLFQKVSNQRVPIGTHPPGLTLPGRPSSQLTMQPFSSSSRASKNINHGALSAVQERLLREFVPASIVLNESFDAVHVYGDVAQFVRPIGAGKVSNNINDMIHEDLSVAVSTALYRCEKCQEDIFYTDVTLSDGEGKSHSIDLSVFYIRSGERDSPLGSVSYVLQFQVNQTDQESDERYSTTFDAAESSRQRIMDLEAELVKKQEHLQVTIEELETTNEELQSANEELMSANEELQSTNEELQSVNEELYTVNSEYQEKISQLTEVNDDLDSVINATNIGIVFLDESLAIRKFTAVANQYIHLLDTDIGRPFHHQSHDLKYDELINDIAHVSNSGEMIEKAVYTKDDTAVLVRILPYRNSGGRISRGIVLTLTNISRQRFVEAALEKAQSQLRSVVLEGSEQLALERNRKGIRVMLLEDDDVDQQRMKRMLQSSGRDYKITLCSTIDEAVTCVGNQEFDIWLLDYRLPGGTVGDFLERIGEHSTPGILMSGYVETDLEPGFLEAGVYDFLNKDELTAELLVRSIDFALERKKVQRVIDGEGLTD